MGWLRALFGGHSPEATREVMKLAIRQNLKRADNRPPVQARVDAASHALYNRYRVRGYDKPLEIVAIEVLPFAFLPSDFEAALAEYSVAGEHRGKADAEWLVTRVREGVRAFMTSEDQIYAPARLKLYQLLTDAPEFLPWAIMLDEESLGVIWEGAKSTMEQLGLDTSGMTKEEEG